jgi:hypothetical protein
MLHHSKPDGEPYPLVECAIHQPSLNGRTPRVADELFWKRDGTHFPVEYVKTPILDERGALEGTVITFRDVTERRQLQRQLVQSQKMDAIGRLADGLGLSTCYGVIRRYGGYIGVDSAPGRGSTFRVYLPSNSELEPEQLAPGPNGPARTLQGHETVLLAKDDPSVRALVSRALRQIRTTEKA